MLSNVGFLRCGAGVKKVEQELENKSMVVSVEMIFV